MSAMTPRQRVQMALNHEEADRVPFIFGVDLTTGINRRAYQALKQHLGVTAEDRYMYGSWRELGDARVDEQVLQLLGSDGRGIWDRKPAAVEERNIQRDPAEPYRDEFGVGQIETSPGQWFPGLHPMVDASLDDLDAFPWPDIEDPTCVAGVRERAQELARENQYAIFAAPWLISPFERAMQLQGMQQFLINMITQRDFAQALLEKLTGLLDRYLVRYLDAIDNQADVVILADDLGSQDRLLISPQLYRELLKPLHARLIESVHQRSNAKVFFHSDGDIFELIDDLVEIGVDILNPIQSSAGEMANLDRLKRRYGDLLCFCGAIDTRSILPHGSVDEVANEVRRVINHLGPGGGYLVAAVHTITNDVPPENILALARAIDTHGRYPLSTR